jgi:hypothetical protein
MPEEAKLISQPAGVVQAQYAHLAESLSALRRRVRELERQVGRHQRLEVELLLLAGDEWAALLDEASKP